MATKDNKEVKAPEGFDVNLGRLESAGWVAREPGNQVTAEVLGRYEFGSVQRSTGKKQAYYQLRLLAPCLVYPNREGDDEAGADDNGELPPAIKMDAGAVVNLAESFGLQDLKRAIEILERGGSVDVWTGYIRKEPNRSGQGTHWVHFGPRLRVNNPGRPEHPL